jgi:hypothetical protein
MPIFKYFIPVGFQKRFHIVVIVFFLKKYFNFFNHKIFFNEKHIKYSSNLLYVQKLLEVWIGS